MKPEYPLKLEVEFTNGIRVSAPDLDGVHMWRDPQSGELVVETTGRFHDRKERWAAASMKAATIVMRQMRPEFVEDDDV